MVAWSRRIVMTEATNMCLRAGAELTTTHATKKDSGTRSGKIAQFPFHSPELVSIWEGEVLPIHCGWSRPDCIQIAQRLLAIYDEGVRLPNEEGYMPLHIAIMFGAPLEAVQFLVEAYPNGLHTRTSNGIANLPIHLACSRSRHLRNTNVIRFLIDKYQIGLRGANGQGMLPLHLPARIRSVPSRLCAF